MYRTSREKIIIIIIIIIIIQIKRISISIVRGYNIDQLLQTIEMASFLQRQGHGLVVGLRRRDLYSHLLLRSLSLLKFINSNFDEVNEC